MGSSRWSDDHYKERATLRAAKNEPTFAYTDDIRRGKAAAKVHDKMDPKNAKVRECRDSAVHPESRAVAVLFDVTGSMQGVPRTLQAALPKLMGLLIRKGYLEHPAILIGAVGDFNSDTTPLQVGQFESGIEIEEDLQKLFLEGGGGGSSEESYELAMHFMATHTAMDCWEKRGQKGYLFFIGDEKPYPKLSKDQVEKVIGDVLEADEKVAAVMERLKERWEVFTVIPNLTNHWNDKGVHDVWHKLIGQNYLKLEDPSAICEVIAGQIGVCEGFESGEVAADMVEAGTDKRIADAVSKALAPVAGGGKGTDVSVAGSGAASGVVKL
jgi:hypothetical protein